jgi:hypothetical protein
MRGSIRDVAEHCVSLLPFLLVITLASCGDSALAPNANADTVTLRIFPESIRLRAGGSQQLTAHVSSTQGKTSGNVAVTWSTDAPSVARIDADGVLTAVGEGFANIRAVIAGTSNGDLVAHASTAVKPAAVLEFLTSRFTLTALEDTVQLAFTVREATGEAISDANVSLRSTDTGIVSVTSAGSVIARAAGIALVIAAWEAAVDTALIEVVPSEPAASAYSADAFVNSVGVNVHLSYLDRVYGTHYGSIIKPKVRELGIRHLRDGGNVWPDEGWMQLVYGRYRDLAESTGARFTIIMAPAGTASGPGRDYTDASHVRTLLDRIGWDNVESFEGLNEHDWSNSDLDWPTSVRTFQHALHAEIKKDPALAQRYSVLGPSLARADNARLVGDLTPWMDRAVMHPYPGGREPNHDFDYNLQTLRVMNGSLPLVATETGYHTTPAYSGGHPSVSERAMGKYVPRLFLEYFRAGVVRTFSYELIDQGTDPADSEQNFGLLHVDGTEKPAFRSLRNLIALLADPGPLLQAKSLGYQLQGDTANIHQLLFQKRDGRFYLVLWQAVPSYDVQRRIDIEPAGRPLTLRLPSAAGTARVYSPMLGASPLTEFKDASVISIVVQDHPLVIEITR